MSNPSRPTVTIGKRIFTILFPDLVRPLRDRERQDLKNSIRKHGVKVPVLVDEDDGVIDGGHRIILASEVGLVNVPTDVRKGLDEAAKLELAMTLNADRRHLSAAERKQFVKERKQRVAQARQRGESIRTIAAKEGIDPKQVRRDLGSSGGDMSPPEAAASTEKVVGKDGKTYQARKKPRPDGDAKADTDKPVTPEQQAAQRVSELIGEPVDLEKDSGQELIRKGELALQKVREKEAREDRSLEDREINERGVGVIRANEAINCLIRIPKNDPLRKRGFQIVADWIKSNGGPGEGPGVCMRVRLDPDDPETLIRWMRWCVKKGLMTKANVIAYLEALQKLRREWAD